MPRSAPTADDRAAHLREPSAPLIAAELHSARLAADAGKLPDSCLRGLIKYMETHFYETIDGSVKLTAAEHSEARSIAVAAIHRQHGGRFRDNKIEWTSDGLTMKAGLPT